MRKVKLTKQEKKIEDALVRGEYRNISRSEFEDIALAIAHRKKDAVLNVRVNRYDLEGIKHKARKLGVKYQTFLSEVIHRVAHSEL